MAAGSAHETLVAGGWKERALPGFMGHAGPLWTRREGDAWAYGMRLEDKHLNPAGRVHGGALMTLLDHAVSAVAWEAAGRVPCVTLQLDSQFLGAALAGQFAEVRVGIVRQTGSLVFARAELAANGEPLMIAQAILKKLAG